MFLFPEENCTIIFWFPLFLYVLGDGKNANIDDDENDNVGDKMGDEANIWHLLKDFAGLDCVEAG